eukprot:scaffold1854_cov193-Alexandrium_tamarense.AAC.2
MTIRSCDTIAQIVTADQQQAATRLELLLVSTDRTATARGEGLGLCIDDAVGDVGVVDDDESKLELLS